MTMRLCVVLVLLFTSTGCGATSARQDANQLGTSSKVSEELKRLFYDYSEHLASNRSEAFRPANPLMRVVDQRVVIDAVAAGNSDVLKADLESLGMRDVTAFGRVVSGELPIAAIPSMAGLASLNFARAATPLPQRESY
jgi:hypothetical protein